MWAKLKEVVWEWRGVWIAAPLVTVPIVLLRFAGLLQSWEWAVYDQYMRLRPAEPPDHRVVIVGMDESDITAIAEVPFPDSVFAKAIAKLKQQQPRAIGLDVYRDLPVPPGTEALEQLFATTPNLVGIEKVVGELGRETVAPPPTLKKLGQVGANDFIRDADGKVRRGLIEIGRGEEAIVSLGFYLAALYLEGEGIAPEVVATDEGDMWMLGDRAFPRFQANDGGYVRADTGGYQVLMNYRDNHRPFDTVSLTDVLEDRIPPDWARDRIVLIGAVGETFQDFFMTPYSAGLIELPKPKSGVEVHAHLTSQILSTVMDGRSPIKTWAEWQEWLWIFLWASLGATVSWKLRHASGTQSPSPWQSPSYPIAAIALLGSTYLALLWGWWIPVVPPALGFLCAAAAITTYIARTAAEIRKTFGRYLTDQVVANLLESPEGLKLGGEKREITILTSDLRGFTAISERLAPEEVIKVLNVYLGAMANVITDYQGTIDEFMGDGILVLFGAPTKQPDDAERAIACAVAMQLALGKVNEQMEAWGLPNLDMGIGINTGEVVVGNIGSEKRAKYGVVGSNVNLTYRIESYTTGGQILISEPTLQQAGAIVQIRGQREVEPKGVKHPITIYDVAGIAGKYKLYLLTEEEQFFSLPKAIPLRYTLLEGKHISQFVTLGCLVALSAKGGLVCLSCEDGHQLPPPLSNIKLNFDPMVLHELGEIPKGEVSKGEVPKEVLKGKVESQFEIEQRLGEDVYAKVTEGTADAGKFYIRFTASPPDVTRALKALYRFLREASQKSQ